MPELPEVETIRRGLAERLTGRRISGVRVLMDKIARPDPAAFAAAVTGRTIRGLTRRGKVLVWRLDKGLIAGHLKMTGRFDFVDPGTQPEKHTHVVFEFEGRPFELHYNDLRQFGWLHALPDDGLDRVSFWNQLGPDALDVSPDRFRERFQGRRGRLKPLLLSQNLVAGLGNIYVDESLHRAGIHPMTTADSLCEADIDRLHGAMTEVLSEAVELGGSSISDYRNAEGKLGYFQTKHRVYGKSGQVCPVCGREIERIKLGGRSTCYCPGCQPAPKED